LITSLTDEQRKKLSVYKDKWIKIGLSTERFDKDYARSIIDEFYEGVMSRKKIPIFLADNPHEGWFQVVLLKLLSKAKIKITETIIADCDEKHKIKAKKLVENNNIVMPYIYGSFDSWYSFYDYFDSEVLKLKKRKKFNITKKLSFLGVVWACNDFCVVTQKPIEINKNEKGLHCENGPSLIYAGKKGLKLYHLNGVKVPKYLVITKAEDLSLDFFNKEKNADIRAEFIRKYGIDRMVSKGKIIDTWEKYKNNLWWVKSEYELLDMASIFKNIQYAPHVKMKNQTTGIFHLEAVPPHIKTLEDAMKFRHNGRDNLKTFNIK